MLARRDLIASYRVPVIWGSVVVVALLGLVAGWLMGLGVEQEDTLHEAPVVLLEEGIDGLVAEPDVARQIADAAGDPETLISIAIRLHLGGDAIERADGIAAWPTAGDGAIPVVGPALIPLRGFQPPASLVTVAEAEPPMRWANRALGDQALVHDEVETAIGRYAAEGSAFVAAEHSRRLAVTLAIAHGEPELLAAWDDDPAWDDVFDARTRLMIANAQGDWPAILRWQLPALYADLDLATAAIAAVAALVWLTFLWHCSHGGDARRELALLCLLGFGLGVVSTWLTLLAITAQEQIGWQLDDGSAFGQALDAILGIGLREELLKLLCILPLAPWLLRRHGQLAWLLVASCVGAGFAAQENVLYFQGGAGVGERFLTANFLHVALTGMVGLAALQAIRWPAQMAQHFAATFLLVVIAHGLYDAFLMVDAIQAAGFSWGFLVVYILAGNAYFAVLAQERPAARPDLSLTWVFCVGLTATMAVAVALLSSRLGLGGAFDLLVPGFLSTAIVIVMFVRGIGDRLSD